MGFFHGFPAPHTSQQQSITSQQTGMQHPSLRQQQEFRDMQLWRRFLDYKKLQESQRQQQHPLDLSFRQHNLHSRLPIISGQQPAVDQSPYILSGMPTDNAPKHVWSGEQIGHELNIPSRSHMFLAGTTHSAQHGGPLKLGVSEGVSFTHTQVQTMKAFGFSPQEVEQTLYGAPILSSKNSSNLQFQVPHGDCVDMMAKACGAIAKNLSINSTAFGVLQGDQYMFSEQALQYGQSVPKQELETKGFLGSVPEYVLDSGSALGQYQQTNLISESLNSPGSQTMQLQNLKENTARCIISSSMTGFDPEEERILLDTDDCSDRAPSFGSPCSTNMAAYPYSNPLQNYDNVSDCPTQNGSWSALMQEAIEASSSDTGLHEEWSGLTFNNTEFSGIVAESAGMKPITQRMQDTITQQQFSTLPNTSDISMNDSLEELHGMSKSKPKRHMTDKGRLRSHLNVVEQNYVGADADENSATTGNDLYNLGAGKQGSSVQSNQEHFGHGKFPYHPMGKLEMELQSASGTHAPLPWTPTIVQEFKDQEQAAFTSSNNAIDTIDMWKAQAIASPMSVEGSGEMQNDSLLTSFDASSDDFSQTYKIGQTSQNMLHLHQMVDPSKESNSATCFSGTGQSTQAKVPESVLSDGSSCLQQNQSTLQTFGLNLSPPSQWQPDASAALPCLQAGSEFDPRVGSVAKSKDQSGPTSNQHVVQQQQHVSSGAGLELIDHRALPYFKFTADLDAQFCPESIHRSHDGAMVGQCAKVSESSGEMKYALGVCSTSTRNSDLQLLVTQTSLTQPLGVGLSKEGGFSSTQHNRSTNLSSQQLLSDSQSHMQVPNSYHSFSFGLSSKKLDSCISELAHDGSNSKGGNASANSKDVVDTSSLKNDIGALNRSVNSRDIHTQSHSLLQQIKTADPDSSGTVGKVPCVGAFGAKASQLDLDGGQNFAYGQNIVRNKTDGTLIPSSSLSDVRTQHYGLNENEGMNRNPCAPMIGGTELKKICPQMAPTWFGQTGNYNTNSILSVDNGLGCSQWSTSSPWHIFQQIARKNIYSKNVVEQSDGASQVVGPQKSILFSHGEHSPSCGLPSHEMDNNLACHEMDNNLASRPNKRKREKAALLSWNAELVSGCCRMRNISVAELDWAQAANRLVEKVGGDTSLTRPQKRLATTTRLMQQILPALPAKFLMANVATLYGNMVFLISRLALGDACGLVSCSVSGSHKHIDGGKMLSNEIKTSEKAEGQFLAKVVETCIGGLGKLESFLSRVEKIPSLLDLRTEFQDLERCCILNHFVKFYARAKRDGADRSNSAMTFYGATPHRQVRVLAVPQKLPESVLCHSL